MLNRRTEYSVACDVPTCSGLSNEIIEKTNRLQATNEALRIGWKKLGRTRKWACPTCVRRAEEKRVEAGTKATDHKK